MKPTVPSRFPPSRLSTVCVGVQAVIRAVPPLPPPPDEHFPPPPVRASKDFSSYLPRAVRRPPPTQ